MLNWIYIVGLKYIYIYIDLRNFLKNEKLLNLIYIWNYFLFFLFSFFNIIGYSTLAIKCNIWKFLGEVYWVKSKI